MDTYVVSGATSMMGCALIRSLLRHNAKNIYAIVQPNTKNLYKLPQDKRIQIIHCDSEEYDKLPSMLTEHCDVFYHLAWAHSKIESRARYFDVEVGYQNIGQTLKALQAASDLGCKNFVGAGSQAEYGNRREAIQSPEDPSDPVTAYAIAKDCARRMCMLKAKEQGINVQWVRIFSVYGPHDRKNTLISTILPKLIHNEDIDLTDCTQIWEYLYEDDAGEGLYYAGNTEEHGSNIYCLGSGDARPLKDFVIEMKEITQSNSDLNFGAIPHTGEAVMNLHANIIKLKDNTGWGGPAVTFREGIGNIIKAY